MNKNQNSPDRPVKEKSIQRFMRSTGKLRFFLGPASRSSSGDTPASREQMLAEETYAKGHWEEHTSDSGKRYLLEK